MVIRIKSKARRKRKKRKSIFFSPNKKTASLRLKAVSKRERKSYTTPKLAKKQIPHITGWKTWTTTEIKRSRRKRKS